MVQDLSAACDAMQECLAIVYFPSGRNEINVAFGTLKGTAGHPWPGAPPLLLSRSNWNPRAVLLVREGAYVRDELNPFAGQGVGLAAGPAPDTSAPSSTGSASSTSTDSRDNGGGLSTGAKLLAASQRDLPQH